MTVDTIDFNPQTNQTRDGFIHQANFLTALNNEINTVARYANYRGQRQNVLTALRTTADTGVGIVSPDIPRLARAITTQIINEYSARNLNAISTQRIDLEDAVTRLLVQNIRPDTGQGGRMTPQEEHAYDELRTIVGDTQMSRAKGTASQLAYAQLPNTLKQRVAAVLNDIKTERELWHRLGPRGLHYKYFLPDPNEEFNAEVTGRQRGKHYQGNHTNTAGWLTAVHAPASPMNQLQQNLLGAASPGLTTILTTFNPNVLATLQIGQGGTAPTAFGVEFLNLVKAAKGQITREQLAQSVGPALAQGVSGYVEFNLPGDMSRLVWDVVNNRIYVSAHYKWRLGYNPWFEITGAPAV